MSRNGETSGRVTLRTRNGVTYTLDADGYMLARSDGPAGWDYGRGWRILGFRIGWEGAFVPLSHALAQPPEGRHGEDVYVVDLDHGHRRQWGGPGSELSSVRASA